MAAKPRLVASYFTLAGQVLPLEGSMASPVDLKARADAAARAGFIGIGLETDDVIQWRDRIGFAGMKRVIRDAGLDYVEVEALYDWFATGDRRAASDAKRQVLLQAADELGAAQIKAVGDIHFGGTPISRLGEEFGLLCREAAKVGTQVTIEIFPGSEIRDIASARGIVEAAGEPNGGLLIDIWHMARGGIPYEDIATIPPALIRHIEVDDADRELVGTIFEDTIMRRRLPGQGDLGVPHFLRCVRETGYDGAYGIEILSDEHRALPVEEAARVAFDSTMAQFALIEA